MKKLIYIFLLLPFLSFGQIANGSETKQKAFRASEPQTVTSSSFITTTGADGTQGKILGENISINVVPNLTRYVPTSANIQGHLKGIDAALSDIVITTAGITNRLWLTADQTTITAGTFYQTNFTGKGSTASAIQTVTNDDNQKKYFAQDLIGNAYISTTTFPAGVYAGNLSVSTSPNSAQQRFTVEVYRCDTNGTPITSGVSGAPIGHLGVQVIAILDSGLLNLTSASITNVSVSANILTNFTINVGERVRYHVSAEKVGTDASNITESVYYGSNYNSYIDVPVVFDTNNLPNRSKVVGYSTTDALNALDDKANQSSGTLTSYFYNTSSDIATYKNMTSTPSTGGLQSISTLCTTTTTVATVFASLSGKPNLTFLPSGNIVFNFDAYKSSGTADLQLYAEVYKRASGGTETLLFTSSTTPILTGSALTYNTEYFSPTPISLLTTDRVVVKFIALKSPSGSNPTVVINIEGTTYSRVSLPTSAIGYTPEDVNNKQNSLVVDGTGIKYPTVDAVSGGTVYKRTIAQIRALTGTLPGNNFYTTDIGQEGNWYYDNSDVVSADNTGTILVTSDGKRIKRIKDELDEVKSSWFESPNGSADLVLFNKILAATTKRVIFNKGTFNLQGSTVSLSSAINIVMRGSTIFNGVLNGNGNVIDSDLDSDPITALFTGTFSIGSKVFYYKTMQIAKLKKHWPGKKIQTGGFWYENDGGGATYTVISRDEGAADNSYFLSYWADTDLAGGAGLFVKFSTFLYAKYTGKTTDVDLAIFGAKYDALYLNPSDKKYYSNATYTTLATDNYENIRGAVGQLAFWNKAETSRNLVISRTLVINTKLILKHGSYNLNIRGSGYGDNSIITSNVALDVLIENYYSDASPNALTGLFATFNDLTFIGHNRVGNGLILKNGYEIDAVDRVQFHDFTNAGLVLYGISSTFKLGSISCFRNKIGLLITSTHPYRLTDNTSNSDGLISIYKVSGDYNSEALLAVECSSLGTSLNIQSVKSEFNNNATILIKKSSAQQFISVKNAFTNGDGDFLKIENYAGSLPTIELEGIYHNDPDDDNWDINDLKNSKQIKYFKNPTASFPHIIYTSSTAAYSNGFAVYRDGIASNLGIYPTSGATASRPSGIYTGFNYFDTTINALIVWNGVSWVVYESCISASYTPTLTAGTNITGLTLDKATYTKVGNIVSAVISVNFSTTAGNTGSAFTFSLPVNKTSATSITIGNGTTITANGSSGTAKVITVTNNATGSASFIAGSGSGANGSAVVNFQYSILD